MISEEEAKYSVKKLLQRPVRSLLTILSILLGIAAIFIFTSFGIGLYNYVNQFATASSADKIMISPKGMGAPGLSDEFALTEADLRAVKNTGGVYDVSGMYYKVAEALKDETKKFVFLISFDPERPLFLEMTNVGIYKGRWLTKNEKGNIMLGYNYLIKDKIFPKSSDLNDKITINGRDFKVIGFFDPIGNPQDDSQIYLTNNAMKDFYGSDLKGYSIIIAKVDPKNIKVIVERVSESLRKSRGLDKGKEDFFVQSWEDMFATYSNVLNGIIGFVILIALISVIVSAINTANTMITSVLERKKEIGVMKAVGATNATIFNIFFFESALLGFTAGVLGVGLGWIIASSIGKLLANLGWGFLQPSYPWMLFAGLVFFATATGAISGALPAIRASKISPVEALRYE